MMTSNSVVIIDFDDSFTYNIANALYQFLKINPTVLPWNKLQGKRPVVLMDTQIVVWGPGPGHPSEYLEILSIMQQTFACKKIFNFGICLGHQLLWTIQGGKILPSREVCHGESIEITIPPWGIFPRSYHHKTTEVQRYNSLSIQMNGATQPGQLDLVVNHEVIMSAGSNFLTMQFHPESIGTSCPELFFAVAERFLYNSRNES